MITMILNLITLLALLSVTSSYDSKSAVHNSDEWVAVSSSEGRHNLPHPRVYGVQDGSAHLFVAIASFRDNRCAITLNNLFSKAKYPDRIHIGIVEQIHTEEDHTDCIASYCKIVNRGNGCPHKTQIDTVTFSFQDSRGPEFARSLQNQMMKDEEFCMQVDSHTDVVQDWDIQLIAMWQSIGNEYAVLSTVPPDVSSLGKNIYDRYEVPHICQAAFTDHGMVQHLLPRAAMNLDKPILAPFWSAAFSFSKCHAEKKTPNDPNHLYVFQGEEFSKYARLWTRGYDVYTPNRILVAHDTLKSMKTSDPPGAKAIDPSSWVKTGMKDTYRWEMYESSNNRIKTLLGSLSVGEITATQIAALTQYGLGMHRTLDQFIQFTGIDTRREILFGDRCKQLEWVPFTPDSNPDIDSTDVWGFNAEVLKINGPNIPLSSGNIEYQTFEAIQRLENGYFDNNGVAVAAVVGTIKDGDVHNNNNNDNFKKPRYFRESIQEAEGELWWIFQSIDNAVESIVRNVDNEVGSGHGHRVLKLILLISPVFLFFLYTAVGVLTGSSPGTNASKPAIRNNAKRI